jgi:hypothetical protein
MYHYPILKEKREKEKRSSPIKNKSSNDLLLSMEEKGRNMKHK